MTTFCWNVKKTVVVPFAQALWKWNFGIYLYFCKYICVTKSREPNYVSDLCIKRILLLHFETWEHTGRFLLSLRHDRLPVKTWEKNCRTFWSIVLTVNFSPQKEGIVTSRRCLFETVAKQAKNELWGAFTIWREKKNIRECFSYVTVFLRVLPFTSYTALAYPFE